MKMNGLLEVMICPAVLLQISMMEGRGGPSDEDMAMARQSSEILGEHGDILLYGGGRKGECADLFNRTAHAVAVLAFVPGGVELFGKRYEAGRAGKRMMQKPETAL